MPLDPRWAPILICWCLPSVYCIFTQFFHRIGSLAQKTFAILNDLTLDDGRYSGVFSPAFLALSESFHIFSFGATLKYVKFAGRFFNAYIFQFSKGPKLGAIFIKWWFLPIYMVFLSRSLYNNLWRPIVENFHKIIFDIWNFSNLHRLELGAIFDKLIFTNPFIGYFAPFFME